MNEDQSTKLPHYLYAESIAHCDGGPGGAYEPDEWFVECDPNGGLYALFRYRSTKPLVDIEGRQGIETLAPVVNGAEWPYGLVLSWDEIDGWMYAPLSNEDGIVRSFFDWDPLPVPRLADPAAILALLPPLLRSDEGPLPASTLEWREVRAGTLVQRLADGDAKRRSPEPQRTQASGAPVSTVRDAMPGELCGCGRQAVVVYPGNGGFCGNSQARTVLPCVWCGTMKPHTAISGGPGSCPNYRLRAPTGPRLGV
ncbi:hypothetical protein K388_07093 [Streptomyces sp. KhCrAH-43]|uniref:hypothetical protein n=1 Tax=unclassified Streptomyces TaxID=2593676 RepID=UPI0003753477|nr:MULTISPECIES: hypothetical protein [unclassified Streptomyces]MYS32898.1 hypothetical protein [Streptomyces sp. SID4920]MYX64116.1 hypothetical protein [Streptomyces sp. SID8373]RAJ47856.1 hypothetical protein K388_07093 [Streptomyces sp. KhCrAH-43]